MKKRQKPISAFFLFALLLFYMQFFNPVNIKAQGPIFPLPQVTEPASCIPDVCNGGLVGDPYIYSGECSIGIDRYLSRAIEMNFLTEFNHTGNPHSCDSPYSGWSPPYCHDKYCELIATLPELDAQLIKNVYYTSGHEHELFPGNPWYSLGYQTVKDINYAYDCAGKRRPIIQGNVSEIFNFANFSHMNVADGIDRHIPVSFIQLYFSEDYYAEDLTEQDPMDPSKTLREYYFINGDLSQPNPDLYFDATRMTIGGNGVITQVEFRMWFLYNACTLIDFGYRAIHMGLYTSYASQSTLDPGYEHLNKLANSFRKYAAASGKFVLLSGETPYYPTDNGESPKVGNTQNLIFDFDSRAMRPREISNPQGNGDGVGCDGGIDQGAADLFNTPPCAGFDFPAVVDPCTINSAGGSGGGIPPSLDGSGPSTTCTYEHVPYIVHFDGFSGANNPGQSSPPATPPIPDTQLVSTLTWGYDDHRWFSMLPSECKAAWFKYFYCDRRNYQDGHGFIVMPGIISMNYPEIPKPPEKQLLSDNIELEKAIIEALKPLVPQIVIEEHCMDDQHCEPICRGVHAPPGKVFQTRSVYYVIKVGNKDCSSTYSIHIKDPNGNWLPQELGDTRILYPQMSGVYQIGIRQDNLALEPSTFGTREINEPHQIWTRCCGPVVKSVLCHSWEMVVTTSCLGEDSEKFTEWFEITPDDPMANLSNFRSIGNECQIQSATTVSNNKIQGIAYIYNKQNPVLGLLASYTVQNQSADVLIQEGVQPCPSNARSDDGGDLNLKEDHVNADLQIYPNPANDKLQLLHLSQLDGWVNVIFYDALGKRILNEKRKVTEGQNLFVIDISDFPNGVYAVSIEGAFKNRLHGRFIKQ